MKETKGCVLWKRHAIQTSSLRRKDALVGVIGQGKPGGLIRHSQLLKALLRLGLLLGRLLLAGVRDSRVGADQVRRAAGEATRVHHLIQRILRVVWVTGVPLVLVLWRDCGLGLL